MVQWMVVPTNHLIPGPDLHCAGFLVVCHSSYSVCLNGRVFAAKTLRILDFKRQQIIMQAKSSKSKKNDHSLDQNAIIGIVMKPVGPKIKGLVKGAFKSFADDILEN